MKRWIVIFTLCCVGPAGAAIPASPVDGGSQTLPTCTAQILGHQTYSVGYIWRCVHDSYGYRWVIVG